MKILITGGTQFVSWYFTKRFAEEGFEVTTLNRGNKKGIHDKNVGEIYVDRHNPNELKVALAERKFDFVVDVTAYTKQDLEFMIAAINKEKIKGYIFISSSAVYKESEIIPINESFEVGENRFWGEYGINKLKAEEYMANKMEKEGFPAIILRPPYIYGEGNNVYREGFIFDQLKEGKNILVPNDGKKIIQFIHIEDLYLIVKEIIGKNITKGIFNVGNKEGITFRGWIEECMKVYGKESKIIDFYYKEKKYKERDFFPFYDYQYLLDVTKICEIIEPKITLEEGLKRALKWYISNEEKTDKRKHYGQNSEEIIQKAFCENVPLG